MNDNQQLLDADPRGRARRGERPLLAGAQNSTRGTWGLDPDDVTERLISLGHKRLLPRRRWRSSP